MCRIGVSKAAEAAAGGNPVNTGSRFDQVIDIGIREALRRTIVVKTVTVKTGQPLRSAKPEKAARVANDPMNRVVR